MSANPVSQSAPHREVLIVDDDANSRHAFRLALEEEETYHVLQAADCERAIYEVENSKHILAAFVDQRFGSDDRAGLDILRRLLDARPLLPVILYTAAADDNVQREAYTAGALWYLPKQKIEGPDEIKNLLRVASKLVETMPIDSDPRFLKKILDAVPIEIMVRDRSGRVFWQNKKKDEVFGKIDPGQTYCWHAYENRRNDADDECPFVDKECAVWALFNRDQQSKRRGAVVRIHEYEGRWKSPDGEHHDPAWLMLESEGILGQDGKVQYAVETARDLTTNIEVLKLITSIVRDRDRDESQLLALVAESLVERIGFARARTWSYDLATSRFTCEGAVGEYRGSLVGRSVCWPKNVVDDKLRSREPVVISKEEFTDVADVDVVEDLDPAESSLWAPFFVGQDLAGILVIDRKGQESETFSRMDKYWMDFLSKNVSAVVERIRATSELRKRQEDLEWLRSLDRKMSGIDSIREVLQTVLKAIEERTGADIIQFHRLSRDSLLISLDSDNSRHSESCPMRNGYPTNIGVNARACNRGEAEFLDDTAGDTDFEQFRELYGEVWGRNCPACRIRPASMACLPIYSGSETVGSLCIGFQETHLFSQRERDLLKSASESLAVSLRTTDRLSIAQSLAAEARRVQRVQDMARGLSHSLRGISQVISNLNAGIVRNAGGNSAILGISKGLEGQINNMERLFDALTRHAAGKPSELRSSINIVITDIVTLQQQLFHDYKIELVAKLARECNGIIKDHSKLLVMLDTLIHNAFEAVKKKAEKGEVVISTRIADDDSCFLIQVSDSGGGIDEKTLSTIFDWPENQLSGEPPIHGIGLPMAQQIAKDMGGCIVITSQLGRGTTASIQLPREERRND